MKVNETGEDGEGGAAAVPGSWAAGEGGDPGGAPVPFGVGGEHDAQALLHR